MDAIVGRRLRAAVVGVAAVCGLSVSEALAAECRDADCKGGRVCVSGTCVAPESVTCHTDLDCPGEWVCQALKCAAPKRSSARATAGATGETASSGPVSVDLVAGVAWQSFSADRASASDLSLAFGWNLGVPLSVKRPASADVLFFWDDVLSFRGGGGVSKNIVGLEVRTVNEQTTLAGGAGLLLAAGWAAAGADFSIKPGLGLIAELRMHPFTRSNVALPVRAALGWAPFGDVSWLLFSLTTGFSFNL